MQCWQGEHVVLLVVLGVPMFLLYVGGIPAAIYIILSRNESLVMNILDMEQKVVALRETLLKDDELNAWQARYLGVMLKELDEDNTGHVFLDQFTTAMASLQIWNQKQVLWLLLEFMDYFILFIGQGIVHQVRR